ncbi:putative glycosyltransferase [Bradyrhizobium sp. AZCC 1693]
MRGPDRSVRSMKLSIVTTLYRSASSIEEFYRRVMKAAEAITDEIELVIVNDGSPDNSLDIVLALHQADPRIVVVDLARNFGHHKAMMTGLGQARGNLVFLIDSDLEEPPELLSRFHDRLNEGDCDVVYGVQEMRKGSSLERMTGTMFYSVVDALSDHRLPRNLVTVRLMTRDYVRALVRHRDREFHISNLWQQSGYRQVALPVEKLSLSPTTYSLARRVHMAVKYITTTSTKLLYIVFYGGVALCGLSAVAVLYLVGRYLLNGIGIDGWTSLIVSVWFFGGLTMLTLGILGIYMANILAETQRRPYTVVRRLHRAGVDDAAGVLTVLPRRKRSDGGPLQ